MHLKYNFVQVTLIIMTILVGLVSCSKKPSTPAPDIWLTPATDVLLFYDPTQRPTPPLPSKLTQTVGERKFQFENPEGFLFSDGSHSSIMRNKEDSMLISLNWLEHNGKANALGLLFLMLEDKNMYKVIESPVEFSLGKYQGWSVKIQSPALFDNGLGQIIFVEINPYTVFFATVISETGIWESEAKPIFDRIISTLTFSK